MSKRGVELRVNVPGKGVDVSIYSYTIKLYRTAKLIYTTSVHIISANSNELRTFFLTQTSPTSQLGTRVPAQDYEKLRRQCLAQNKLFEDPYFPADDRSLFYSTELPFKPEWKRPKVSQHMCILYHNSFLMQASMYATVCE